MQVIAPAKDRLTAICDPETKPKTQSRFQQVGAKMLSVPPEAIVGVPLIS